MTSPIFSRPGSPSIFLLAAFLGTNLGAARGQTIPVTSAKVAVENAEKQRLEVFEQVWQTVDQKYYDPKFGGVDWNAMRVKYRPFARYASDERIFYDVLNSMLGELHDKHTSAISPREQKAIDSGQRWTLGFEFAQIEDVLAIASVKPDSEAARAGVKAGMRVQSIDGKPVSVAIRPNSGRASGGTLDVKKVDQPIQLGLIGADGALLEVSLKLVQEPRYSLVTKIETSAAGAVVIKFDQFNGRLSDEIAAELKAHANAPTLVIDLRNNLGGSLEVCLKLLSYFFNDEILVGKRITRGDTPGAVPVVEELKTGKKGGQLYPGPVAVLINQYSASGSELFASTMQEQHRAAIIGTRSSGALLGIRGYRQLKDGGQVGVSEVGFVSAQGRIVEGQGVIPDQKAPLRLADLQQGRDAALEAAEAYFAGLKKQPVAFPTPK